MIGSLRGELLDRSPDGELLIETGGVGYRVTATPATLASVGEIGGVVFVHVHHHITEGAQQLYGFTTVAERRTFEALLGAHGVGPALALSIISVHQPDQLRLVVATDDIDGLCLVPGVGKKTAARLLIELKSRFAGPLLSRGVGPAGAPNGSGQLSSTHTDVRAALAELGYGAEEVRVVLTELPVDGEVSDLLREALQRLATF